MKKGDRTRLRLLECAAELVASHGSNHLTVRALAARAEVSPGSVTRYFPKVDQVFPAVIDYVFARYFEELPDNVKLATGEARLVGNARFGFQHWTSTHAHHHICIMHAYAYVSSNKAIARILHQMVWGSVERSGVYTRQMVEERGLTATDRQIDLFAHMYMQLLQGGLEHCMLIDTKAERRAYADKFLEVLQARIEEFLSGLNAN